VIHLLPTDGTPGEQDTGSVDSSRAPGLTYTLEGEFDVAMMTIFLEAAKDSGLILGFDIGPGDLVSYRAMPGPDAATIGKEIAELFTKGEA
jgi:hypothetical protein